LASHMRARETGKAANSIGDCCERFQT
jgi:hypothetical protein